MTISSPIRKQNTQRGFSLLEMTLVLLILALLTGMYLSYQVATRNEERYNITASRLEKIQFGLLEYRRVNHRLPCPALPGKDLSQVGYGVADTAGNCTNTLTGANVAAGAVPAKALNLLDEFMYDGWGRKFTYAVDPRATATCATTTYGISDATIGLRVDDENLSDSEYRSDNAWYVLVSHGQNGHGAYLTGSARYSANSTNDSELLNCHCNSSAAGAAMTRVFVERQQEEVAGEPTNRFDDITRFANRINLRSQEEETGRAETCP